MRLTDESTAKFEIELVNKQVQKIKQAKKDCQTHYGKQLGCGTCKALQLCMWIDELVDTTEAMRKHIEALQAENEQLRNDIMNAEMNLLHMTELYEQPRVQVEMMRETLEKARKVLHKLRAYEIPGFGETCEALAEIDKAIGGKEDV